MINISQNTLEALQTPVKLRESVKLGNNLVKSDFSDFSPSGGALVTINKTFPIDVFNGRRNLWIKKMYEDISKYDGVNSYRYKITNLEKNVRYSAYIRLKQGATPAPVGFYIGINDNQNPNATGTKNLWLLVNGKIDKQPKEQTFLNENIYVNFYPSNSDLKILDSYEIVINRMVSGLPTVYSPSPEDGYDYKGLDCSYHVQTSGGTSSVKLNKNIQNLDPLKETEMVVDVFAFNAVRIYNGTNNQVVVQESDRVLYSNKTKNNFIDFQFRTRDNININESLDFIAYNPIIETEGSYFDKQIKKVELNKEGMINRSNLSQLKVTLHGEHDLQGQYFNFERSFTTLDNIVHTITYGQYRVIKQEYKDNDKTTDLELYDNMIKTQVEYKNEDINVTFPITLLNMFKKVASTVGLQTDVTTFPLSNETIKLDVWSNTSYTYRDVLDHIAEISGNTIYIKDNKLFITGGQTTGVTIDYKRSKALKVSEKVGKFNLLNLTREPQHDNYAYPTNWASIPIDDRKEYVIQNNAIIDNDREVWASKIFNNIKDLEYTPFEADTFGWGIFDIGDKVTVKDLNGKTYQSIITSEINSYNGMWTTKLESKKLSNAKDKYVVITDQRRQGQTVYFLVDQQNGVIEGIINNVTQLGETTTQLRLDLESLLLRVNSVGNPNIIYNLNGESDYDGWSFPVSLPLKFKQRLRFFSSMRWSNNFVPSVDNSLSGNKITFVNKGESLSSKGRVIKGDKYSYRGVRVGNESRFKIYVREYTSMDNETTFTDSLLLDTIQPKKVEVASINLKATTVAVRLRFVTEVGLALTDQMFNRGEPREWELSAEDVKVWAESQILIRDNTIALQAQEIDNLNNDIHNAGVEINAVEGVTVYGKNFKVQDEKRERDLLTVDTVDGNEAIKMVGDIETTDGVIKLSSKDKSISIGNVTLQNKYDDSKIIEVHSTNISQISNEVGSNSYFTMGVRPTETTSEQVPVISVRMDAGTVGGSNITTHANADFIRVHEISTGFGRTINIKGDLIPVQNNTYMVGSSSLRYNTLFLQNQPNVASDTRYKDGVVSIDSILIKHFKDVEPKMYRTKFSNTIHFGYIAQDVERALYKYLLETQGKEKANKGVKEFAVLSKDESYMSLLYGEIQVIKDAYHNKKILDLEERLTKLEGVIK